MDRIKILQKEIEIIEKDKSDKIFIQLISNEKLEYLNDQLEIIKKKLEITNILLEDELEKRFVQEIIGRPPNPDIEKQKTIVDMIIANKEYISPTILGIYGKNIDQRNPEEKLDYITKENEIDVKVNINQV